MTEYKKKLIEVALPLEAINRESAREKSIRHGHPSTLHLWWSRKPLAACRAVLFSSLVDDPSAHPEHFPTEEEQEAERQRLFRIIEELVKWENTTNATVFKAAQAEIMRCTDGSPPPALDPFCGGGSIPLEAQRLGLDAYASDLNPVAVLITKALIEIPPKFAGLPPVNPESHGKLANAGWEGAQGLAEDVRFYGRWMRDRAHERIGHLYPTVKLPADQGGGEATVVAWLYCRSAKCPNPACGAEMPLASKWTLSTKKGKRAWTEPVVDVAGKSVRFEVRTGTGMAPEGTVNRQGARCIVCGTPVSFDYIRAEGRAARMGNMLLAVVADGGNARVYLNPSDADVDLASSARPGWVPDTSLPDKALGFRVQQYGLTHHRDLFSTRQLTALSEFVSQLDSVCSRVISDGGDDSRAKAIRTYLTLAIGRSADFWSRHALWAAQGGFVAHTFSRQALSMVWDNAEVNPFSSSTGNWLGACEWVSRCLEKVPASGHAVVRQLDATAASSLGSGFLISTDPPYYDNIPYADLSDYFYVWLRRSLKDAYPELLSTLLVPKAGELIAEPARHGGVDGARQFFEDGMKRAFAGFRGIADPDLPMTVYYAFKQTETEGSGATASTGWETMLAGLLSAGYAIVGTWPVRSERAGRLRDTGSNALASSIVLVCRLRSTTAALATRKEFLASLRAELPKALRQLQHGNIAPVDLAQASIGPGMAIFSRYSKIVEADGSPMSVRTGLALINQALDEVVAEQEGEFDADTRWAIAWFEEIGLDVGDFGRAELLSRAKNTSVQGMVEAGIVEARAGKVRLLRRDELDDQWNPTTDNRLTVWEMTQHLIQRLDEGEAAAADLSRQLGSYSEVARDLAYRLYLVCERKKWAQEALAYNGLVVAWPQIQRLAAAEPAVAGPSQTSFEV